MCVIMKNKLKRYLVIFFATAISLLLLVAFDIYRYGNVNEMRKADAAIILGAAVWKGKPSPVFEERIKHGMWLYRNGRVDKLIFTGGKGENSTYADSVIAKRYAVAHAIPGEDILVEERSTITEENIRYAAQVAKQNDLSSLLIVSDPLHMRRAMSIARDLRLNAYPSPTPSTRYRTPKTKSIFLAREVMFYIGYEFSHLCRFNPDFIRAFGKAL